MSFLNHLFARYDYEFDDPSYRPQTFSYVIPYIDLTVNSLVDHLCR